MNKRDSYEKCMTSSIENAEAWLNEAKLLVERGTKAHAHVLNLFAVEELGKAMLCWFTINKVYPYNHQEVDFRSKKSIFRSHSLKGGAALGFLFGMTKAVRKIKGKDPKAFVQHPETGKKVKLMDLLPDGGKLMTQGRSLLMYVDMKKGSRGIEVSNPLDHTPPVETAIEDTTLALGFLRIFIENSSKYIKYFEEQRKIVKAHKDFPKNPEWY